MSVIKESAKLLGAKEKLVFSSKNRQLDCQGGFNLVIEGEDYLKV
jgi:hypothetical protein